MDMDKETQKRVEEVVPDRKLLVKQIIDTFSEQFEREKTTKEDEQEEDEQEEKCDKVVNTFCEKVEREKTRDYKEEEEDEEEEEEQAKKNVADDNEMRTKKRKTGMESIVGGGGGGGDEETKDILICKLSKMRMVTVRKYNGVRYVCIRNYILRDEKMLPTEKGVNMKVEQWEALCNASPEIEKALKKLEDNTDDIS